MYSKNPAAVALGSIKSERKAKSLLRGLVIWMGLNAALVLLGVYALGGH